MARAQAPAASSDVVHMLLDSPDSLHGHIDTAFEDQNAQNVPSAEWLASEAETYNAPLQSPSDPQAEAPASAPALEATTVDMQQQQQDEQLPRFASVEAGAEAQAIARMYLEQPDISAEAASNPSVTAALDVPPVQHDKTEASHDQQLGGLQFSHQLFDEPDPNDATATPTAQPQTQAAAVEASSASVTAPAPTAEDPPATATPSPSLSPQDASQSQPSQANADQLPSNVASASSAAAPSVSESKESEPEHAAPLSASTSAIHSMRLRRIPSNANALQPAHDATDNEAAKEDGETNTAGQDNAKAGLQLPGVDASFKNLDKDLAALNRESDRTEEDTDAKDETEGLGDAISSYLQDAADYDAGAD